MVMLYQDPDGESVGITPSLDTSVPKFTTTQSTTAKFNGSGEQVIVLEKTVQEKENKIKELTLEINALKVGILLTIYVIASTFPCLYIASVEATYNPMQSMIRSRSTVLALISYLNILVAQTAI